MSVNKNMKIYTKEGDNGTTSLMKTRNIPKNDDRIQLLGTIDELTSNLGLLKASGISVEIREQFERIQKNLMTIMAGIADPYNKDYRFGEEVVAVLEEEIDRLEEGFPRDKKFVLPGKSRISAQTDIARTVARRAERWMVAVDRKFTVDKNAKRYLNRLADYLYVTARYMDFLEGGMDETTTQMKPAAKSDKGAVTMTDHDVIQAVLEKLGQGLGRISLESAKKLIGKVEEECVRKGLSAVIAVCGPDGNPGARHVMDNAFLASFDIAMKKAYTSVAVKMSTRELGKLALPGQTFYGIDKADNGRMIIFGGGVPLSIEGRIIGGLGVSGGTSEQDAEVADFGQSVLESIL